MSAAPASPFKGLAAFEDSEIDALFFFGREREREVVVANLLASRLTVLYGESGVGKTSLLAAGVARQLRTLEPRSVVSVHDTWSGGLEGVFDDVRGTSEGYVILDQFEEYFLYYGDDDRPGTLLHELPELLRESRVNVLVALREDGLARLDAFKARIPTVFANQVRLEHLDRVAARAATLGPIERWNELTEETVSIEPALVDAVLDEVAVEGRSQDRDRVEAPYLQLVLERIWETERAGGSKALRLETLRGLGGAKAIVRDHLLLALAALGPAEQEVAASMFEHLVTPSGTKIAHRAPDLAEYADVPESALRDVLGSLTRDRIVHSVDGSDRYEIFHDVLAEPIRTWRGGRRLEQERLSARRRQRRLYALTTASLVALAIVAGLAVWAFSERSHARSQAHHARARELEATALQQLTTDPNRSLRLALAAARLEPGNASETVLRQALNTDRLRATVYGGGGPVTAVAIAPNGKVLAAATSAHRIVLADPITGNVLRTLRARTSVTGLSFTRGGTELLSAAPAGRAATWNVRTGRETALRHVVLGRGPDGRLVSFPLRGRLAEAVSQIQFLRVSRDLAAAAVLEPTGRVRAWIFDRRGRRLRVLPQIGIRDIAFSPDGRLVATASIQKNGFSVVWDPRSGKPVRKLRDSKNGVNVLAFSPDGKLLATGGQDSGVRVWTLATGERTFFLFAHINPVTVLAWSPDGRVLTSGSSDRNVMLWRVQTPVGSGSLAATLAGHREAVGVLAFSSDGARLVSGSDDGTVRVWDASPDPELRLLGRARGSFVGAVWTSRSIVAASTDGSVQVFDSRTQARTLLLRAGGGLTSFGASADGSVVAAGYADGRTAVWDGRTGRALASVAGPAPTLAVAVSPSGDLVAEGDRRGVLRVMAAKGGRVRWTRSSGSEIVDVTFSFRGDELASAGGGGVALWSTATGRSRVLPVGGGASRVRFSPDGRLVGAGANDGTVRLWFTGTGHPYRILRGHKAAVTDVAFSPDGTLLASSSSDADGRVWDVKRGLRVHTLRGHFGTVSAIAFSPNGRWLVTAGPISAGLWPRSSGLLMFYLRGHVSLLRSVAFSPDGKTILSSSTDGTVRTFRCEVCVDLQGLERLAKLRLFRTH